MQHLTKRLCKVIQPTRDSPHSFQKLLNIAKSRIYDDAYTFTSFVKFELKSLLRLVSISNTRNCVRESVMVYLRHSFDFC